MVLKEDLEAMIKGGMSIPLQTQAMTFPEPKFFEMSLRPLVNQLKNNRRLKYKCADGSEGFTVYFTMFGVFGIPEDSITCADGSMLINYDPSKNYVFEQ